MATSIGKLSKSFFLKLLVGIIILPFVFWGMGDVFRGGNQNVVATVDSNKISTQEFVNYINRLNLNEEQVKNLSKTDLVEQILSDYIGKKVMSLEIEKLGVVVSDNALRDIIKNDKSFFKDDKFSRTEYEKFLLKSRTTAPQFEANIVEQDEREKSVRAHLNFGHTFAHAIESVQSFKGLNHGEAVGVGMVCAAKLSLLLGKINSQEFDKIKSLIKKFNLPTKLPANCEPARILKAMQSDKKSKDTTLRFIILDGIGKVKIVENVDREKILNSLKI